MPLNDIGPRAYKNAIAAASLSFTPLYDRAAVIKKILVDKVSAGDVWRIKCQGKELAAFDIETYGNQQPLAGPYSGYPKNNDLFDIYEEVYGEPLIFPVPLGQTFSIASDGGATGDVSIEFTEVAPNEITPGMMNHPNGNRIVTLLTGYVAAAVSAVGLAKFDTQIGPNWFPNIFADGMLPPNWQFRVLCKFLEGGGRNPFNGGADHQSVTQYLEVKRNGQTLYTREADGGLPLVGQPSAADSANTVVGTDQTSNPPIQESNSFDWSDNDPPLVLGAGDSYQFRLNIAGDVGSGADFSHMRQVFLVDVRNPGH